MSGKQKTFIAGQMLIGICRRLSAGLRAEVEHLEGNMAILSNPELLEKIRQARSRIAKGEGVPLEK